VDIFKGAGRNSINGKKKGGLKLHTKMPMSGFVPDLIHISEAATLEVEKDTTTIVASIVLGTGTTGFVGANRERLYRMKQGRKNTSPTNSDM
jgi:hypothetical protein